MIILIYKISIAIRPSVLLNICLTSVDFRLYYNVQAIKQFAVENVFQQSLFRERLF